MMKNANASFDILKDKFQSWSGFQMESSNLEDAIVEIDNMVTTLTNEIHDYGRKLEALAKEAFKNDSQINK